MLSWYLARQQFHVRIHHDANQLLESYFRFPAEDLFRLRRIADEQVDLRWTFITRIVFDVLFPIKIDMCKGRFGEFAHSVRFAGRDDEIVALSLLQYLPHGLDILRRVTPVALRFKVAKK